MGREKRQGGERWGGRHRAQSRLWTGDCHEWSLETCRVVTPSVANAKRHGGVEALCSREEIQMVLLRLHSSGSHHQVRSDRSYFSSDAANKNLKTCSTRQMSPGQNLFFYFRLQCTRSFFYVNSLKSFHGTLYMHLLPHWAGRRTPTPIRPRAPWLGRGRPACRPRCSWAPRAASAARPGCTCTSPRTAAPRSWRA